MLLLGPFNRVAKGSGKYCKVLKFEKCTREGGGGPPIIFVHKDKRHKEDFLLPKRCLKGHFPAIYRLKFSKFYPHCQP